MKQNWQEDFKEAHAALFQVRQGLCSCIQRLEYAPSTIQNSLIQLFMEEIWDLYGPLARKCAHFQEILDAENVAE